MTSPPEHTSRPEHRTLCVSDYEVAQLLAMGPCIDLMAETLAAVSRGEALLPLRQVIRLPETSNAFALMPAALGDPRDDTTGRTALGAKIITVYPKNESTPYDSHLGVVLLFDSVHGRLLAVLDASSITAIRTAAVSGLATRLLARPDAGDLAILGSGTQAMTHLEAMQCVRPLRRVRVWSRSAARCERFAAMASRRLSLGVEVSASAHDAVAGADLICTVTASRTPVLHGAWIAEGAHINAVGASLATARELDSDAVARARLFTDRRESAEVEAGDYRIPVEEGRIPASHLLGELGDLLLGRVAGRVAPTDITLFKSLGLAVEDVASARWIFETAQRTGAGTWLSLGGMRDAST